MQLAPIVYTPTCLLKATSNASRPHCCKLTNDLVLVLDKLHRRDVVVAAHKGDNWALTILGHGREVFREVVALGFLVPYRLVAHPAAIEVPALESRSEVQRKWRRGDLKSISGDGYHTALAAVEQIPYQQRPEHQGDRGIG
jgi:hypothetical protein